MKKIIYITGVLLLTFGLSAQEKPVNVDNAKPCKEDRKNLCQGIKPGGGRIWKCFKENESKLSEGCKLHIEAKKAEHKEAHAKCKADRKKFCKDVKPGEMRIINCLKEHEAELSAGCKEVISKK